MSLSRGVRAVLRGKPGLTARMPWVVAFSFGLGQLIFVVLALGVAAILQWLPMPHRASMPYAVPYAIGGISRPGEKSATK